ncbi:MAG TPA: hypothetical protein VEA38_11240 [Terriglobales bacterium]|nr:hypothetical protein [Terriglobales bacterium]
MLVDASNLFAAVKKANRRYPDAPRDGVYVSPVRLLGDDSITHEIHIVRRNGGNMTTLLVTEDELRQLRDGASACLGGT